MRLHPDLNPISGKETPDSTLHVVSAWVAPGRTTFTIDAPLPSDGDGRGLALLALAIIVGGTIVWARPRWRIVVLRRCARMRRRMVSARPWLVRVGALTVAAVLFVRGCASSVARSRSSLSMWGMSPRRRSRAPSGGRWGRRLQPGASR